MGFDLTSFIVGMTAVGSGVCSYLSYHASDSTRREASLFANTKTYHSLSNVIDDMKKEGNKDMRVKLYGHLNTTHTPLRIVSQTNDLIYAVFYEVHAERIECTKAIEVNGDVVETVLREKCQEEQYKYILHGDVILSDKKSDGVIHVDDAINLLYRRMDMKILTDESLELDPRFTKRAVTNHVINQDEVADRLTVHTLTEIHMLEEEKEAVKSESTTNEVSEHEEVIQLEDVEEQEVKVEIQIDEEEEQEETVKFYNVLRRIIVPDTRVFVYGVVSYDDILDRYYLKQIFECSNVAHEGSILDEFNARLSVSNISSITFGCGSVLMGAYTGYRIVKSRGRRK